MNPGLRLIVADSDPARIHLLSSHLASQGYHVHSCSCLQSVLDRLVTPIDDLVIVSDCLSADLPCNLCLRLRDHGCALPILVLCSSSDYGARVSVLQSGADDALSLPFALEELFARVQALLRRYDDSFKDCRCLECHDLSVDTECRLVKRGGSVVKLSVKEYDLLVCLLRGQGKVITRKALLERVWGDTWCGDDNLLDVYIRYLRKKLDASGGDPLIHTVRGVGFVMK